MSPSHKAYCDPTKMTANGISISLDELMRLRFLARQITIFSGKRVVSHAMGQRLSRSLGRGMEFEEVRAYQAGDDIRLINWQMTARLGRPYTKVYQEERNKPVYLLLDQSSSMYFGTRIAFKSVIAAQVVALLAWSAFEANYQIGGVFFNEQQQLLLPPKCQRQSLLRLLVQVAYYSNHHSHNSQSTPHFDHEEKMAGASLSSRLKVLQQQRVRGALLVFVSDFFSTCDEELQGLARLARDNDVTAFFIYDRLEKHAPSANFYGISDGQQKITINTRDRRQAEQYCQPFNERLAQIKIHCQKNNIRLIPLCSEDNIISKLNLGVYWRG